MKSFKNNLMRLIWLIYFSLYILWEIIISSLKVARDVLTPRLRATPGVVSIPLSTQSNIKITLLANLISLTPGTLTLDISSDKKTLFLHTMFAEDRAALRQHIKKRLEKPITEIIK